MAAKLLGKPIELKNFAQDAICLHPIEEQDVLPAIYLESHLQRVLGSHHLSSVAFEFELLHQKTYIHGATTLYPIGKTRLFRGGLWTEKNQVLTRLLKADDKVYPVMLGSAVLTDSDIANQYFGHWLQDAVPASLVGNNQMPSLAFRKPHYQHATDYSVLFHLNTIYGNSGSVDNLYLLSDFSQNSYKVKRYMELRQRLQNKLNPANCQFDGVFIARGETGAGTKRILTNEKALIEHLKIRNFDIVYPEQLSVEQLIRRLWNAPMIVTIEGSAQNHANYTIALKGAYLILQSPYLVNHVQKGICDAMNRPYGFYVCHPTQNPQEFYLDSMPDLDKLIIRLFNETANR